MKINSGYFLITVLLMYSCLFAVNGSKLFKMLKVRS